jgi:hypothetical protein
MNRALVLAAAAALAVAAGSASAGVIYQNDFSSNANDFSGSTTITTAPDNGQKYLGPLALGQTATLTLDTTGLSSIDLNVDMLALLTLDGSDGFYGPDYFKIAVEGGPTLFNETISNFGGGQTYGGTSDAALRNTLYGQDQTFHLAFTGIAPTGSTTKIDFIGATNQGWSDEGYGIDNVVVNGTLARAVPEPATWTMLLGGVFAMGAALRSRRRAVAARS